MNPALKTYGYSAVRLARKHASLSAILFVGAFLRIYQLGAESLWYDEVVSVWFAHLRGPSEIFEASRTDPNFPPFYLFLHYWLAFFGDSEYAVRLPSALSGILAILALYRVGCLLFGRNEGLVASLILALSPLHIYYSQEARVYEIMVLLALLSFYFFLRILTKGKIPERTGYVLCTSVLLYSHVYGLFIVLAQNLYFATTSLLTGKSSLGSAGESQGAAPSFAGWLFLQVLISIIYAPGLVLLVSKIREPGGYNWITPLTLRSMYADIAIYAGSSLFLVLLLTLSLLASIGLVRSGASGNKKLWLLLTWLLIPVVLPQAISLFSTPIFHYRYGIAASPALYLLAAKGVGFVSTLFVSWGESRTRTGPRVLGANVAWPIATAVLITLASGVLWSYFNTIEKSQWRESARYVNARAKPDDLILVYPTSGMTPLKDYYLKGTNLELRMLEIVVQREKRLRSAADGADTNLGVGQHDRIWLMHDLSQEQFPYDRFFLKESYIPTRKKKFGPYGQECYPYYPAPCGVLHGGRGKGVVVVLFERISTPENGSTDSGNQGG